MVGRPGPISASPVVVRTPGVDTLNDAIALARAYGQKDGKDEFSRLLVEMREAQTANEALLEEVRDGIKRWNEINDAVEIRESTLAANETKFDTYRTREEVHMVQRRATINRLFDEHAAAVKAFEAEQEQHKTDVAAAEARLGTSQVDLDQKLAEVASLSRRLEEQKDAVEARATRFAEAADKLKVIVSSL